MAYRNLITFGHLPKLDIFMIDEGWDRAETKSVYEERRYVKRGVIPVIIYARDRASMHVSIMDHDVPLMRRFLAWNSNNG